VRQRPIQDGSVSAGLAAGNDPGNLFHHCVGNDRRVENRKLAITPAVGDHYAFIFVEAFYKCRHQPGFGKETGFTGTPRQTLMGGALSQAAFAR